METVFDFTLPKGYTDENGNLYRNGRMRLATAKDEISAKRDLRVLSNSPDLIIVLLSKVINFEGIETTTTDIIEHLFTADLAFLEDLYEKINTVEILQIPIVCPRCGNKFEVESTFTQKI